MSAITVSLPSSVTEADAKLYLAIKLYEVGRLSAGQAAEVAGYSKRTFLELLAKQGTAVFDYSPDELGEDLQHA